MNDQVIWCICYVILLIACVYLGVFTIVYWMRVKKLENDLAYERDLVRVYDNSLDEERLAHKKAAARSEDIIKALEDTLCKEQARVKDLESKLKESPKQDISKKIYYIQVKWITPDCNKWESVTKDLFYTRRTFRSLREAAKEAKRQAKNPCVASARIITANERLLGRKEWNML